MPESLPLCGPPHAPRAGLDLGLPGRSPHIWEMVWGGDREGEKPGSEQASWGFPGQVPPHLTSSTHFLVFRLQERHTGYGAIQSNEKGDLGTHAASPVRGTQSLGAHPRRTRLGYVFTRKSDTFRPVRFWTTSPKPATAWGGGGPPAPAGQSGNRRRAPG